MSPSSTQLYFAYGSNLSLQQMANRCPNSYYVGRAILPDHYWQINTRGYANVIPCSGYNVHGLVYAVDLRDERKLDACEGIQTGAYSKSYQTVILYQATSSLQQYTSDLVANGSVQKVVDSMRIATRLKTVDTEGELRGDILVYLSSQHVEWGTPREEYVHRMNSGIADGISLGIPADFFETFVRQHIPDRPEVRRPRRRNRSSRRETQEYNANSSLRRAASAPRESRRRERYLERSPERASLAGWTERYVPRFGFGWRPSSRTSVSFR